MSKKLAIQFKKTGKTQYVFQRVTYCKHCDSYSILQYKYCEVCGREHPHLPLQQLSSTVSRRRFQIQLLVLVILLCLAVICARTTVELTVAIVGSLAILGLFLFVHKRMAVYERAAQFYILLRNERPKIEAALQRHLDTIAVDMEEKLYLPAYEKLREVGFFLFNDRIIRQKLNCLSHFVLRNDMELELESLIPSRYDKHFVAYLREVAKVKPALVKKAVLDYVIRYIDDIRRHEHGHEILVNVTGAALRMKQYVSRYQLLILEYMEFLPKERLLRLAKLVSLHRQEWPELYAQTEEVISVRYSLDPDFNGIFQGRSTG